MRRRCAVEGSLQAAARCDLGIVSAQIRVSRGIKADVHLKADRPMAITLNLKPEVEAGVVAQARASGMTVEEYLLAVVEDAVLPATQNTPSPEERAAAFEAWSAGHRDS